MSLANSQAASEANTLLFYTFMQGYYAGESGVYAQDAYDKLVQDDLAKKLVRVITTWYGERLRDL